MNEHIERFFRAARYSSEEEVTAEEVWNHLEMLCTLAALYEHAPLVLGEHNVIRKLWNAFQGAVRDYRQKAKKGLDDWNKTQLADELARSGRDLKGNEIGRLRFEFGLDRVKQYTQSKFRKGVEIDQLMEKVKKKLEPSDLINELEDSDLEDSELTKVSHRQGAKERAGDATTCLDITSSRSTIDRLNKQFNGLTGHDKFWLYAVDPLARVANTLQGLWGLDQDDTDAILLLMQERGILERMLGEHE